MGEYHVAFKVMIPLVYHPCYSPEFSPDHRFPMEKFGLLAEFLRSRSLLTPKNTFVPEPASEAEIVMTHCPEYVRQFRLNQLPAKAMRRIGIPWSEGVMERTYTAVGGTLLTARLALQYGLAAHLAGGTHHAHVDFGSGFCIFNDLAVVARALVAEGAVDRVLIIDCDVHQGDGTASILSRDDRIFTCSFHCRENFPHRKAQSDFDIELGRGEGGHEYYKALENHLPYIVSISQPDFILYDAGADVHQDDALGYLNLSDEDMALRDEYIIRMALDQGIPLACVIGGGYSRDRKALAARHGIVHQVAARLFEEYGL
ncbi:histone deacetylase [Hahella sp. CCB-MM4]|uniref:histone deacetylase family protein n=1 Tax=Hahella sp. (strain CCB-MM4) TaxID=1926491 RepID=UPI000B9BCF79|nr:histone deacetylase [Hahella sp. CCB-MM4]OZG74469.1 histone deacetylase [Hahella sp. CCB-MM4]